MPVLIVTLYWHIIVQAHCRYVGMGATTFRVLDVPASPACQKKWTHPHCVHCVCALAACVCGEIEATEPVSAPANSGAAGGRVLGGRAHRLLAAGHEVRAVLLLVLG